MNHWIIDREVEPMPTWLEAMPNVKMILRGQELSLSNASSGTVWCRVRAGEDVEKVVSGSLAVQGKHLVVLADEPDALVAANALALGASGCCNTYAAPEVLRQVAIVVQNGGLWIGQALLQKMVASTTRVVAQSSSQVMSVDWSEPLSDRESQVARLVASGASNKEVAAMLSITERTVKAHLSAVFEKLGLRDRLQLSLRINGSSV